MLTTRTRRRRLANAKTTLLAVWIAAVGLFLLWEAAQYQGVMALISEWQFNAYGRQYPTFNYVALVFLLALPGYLLFRRRSTSDDAAILRSARTLVKALLGAALGLGIAALVILVVMLFLPRSAGPAQRIDVSAPGFALPREGPTRMTGIVVYERTAGFDRDLLLTRRTFRFAPVVGNGERARDLRFFVQFSPVDAQTRQGSIVLTGVLKRNGLPGEITRLFRYAGYDVAEPHFVLFQEASAMRWPYLITALQLAIAGLLALGAGLLQRRRARTLDAERQRSGNLAPQQG